MSKPKLCCNANTLYRNLLHVLVLLTVLLHVLGLLHVFVHVLVHNAAVPRSCRVEAITAAARGGMLAEMDAVFRSNVALVAGWGISVPTVPRLSLDGDKRPDVTPARMLKPLCSQNRG